MPATAGAKRVAKVNGTILTEADLLAAFNEIMPAGVFHGGFSSEKRAKHRPRALELMIEKELFYQEALKKGLKIDEKMIQIERERTIRRLGGEEKFKAALKKADLTDKQYREKLRKKFLVERIIAVEIKDKAEATDEEVRTYYESNKSKFVRPEARRLTHILISFKPEASSEERMLKKQRAQEVVDQIKAGADMMVLARKYSDGPYRVKGGDLGLVHRGRLDPDLEKEAFKLKSGQLSGIIETIYGYNVVRVEEIRPPEQLEFEDVSEKIKKQLTAKKESQLRQALADRLHQTARITVY
jgi:peptidyl-prolyl cis-trans isomerase C